MKLEMNLLNLLVILMAGKKYLMTVTNKASADNPINIGMSWYEE